MSLIARGAVTLVGVALAVLAVAAPAMAQGVTVVREPTGAVCAPCPVHIVGESHVTVPSTGLVISACHDELFAQFNADGTGALDWVGTADGGPGCNSSNCVNVAGEAHWPITSTTETAQGVERLNARLCFRDNLGREGHCNISVPISHSDPHRQTFSVLSLCSAGARRVEAEWQAELTSVELVHSED